MLAIHTTETSNTNMRYPKSLIPTPIVARRTYQNVDKTLVPDGFLLKLDSHVPTMELFVRAKQFVGGSDICGPFKKAR